MKVEDYNYIIKYRYIDLLMKYLPKLCPDVPNLQKILDKQGYQPKPEKQPTATQKKLKY